jgi:hypothetical protein
MFTNKILLSPPSPKLHPMAHFTLHPHFHDKNHFSKITKKIVPWNLSTAFKAGENQLVRSGDEDQTRVRFSYFI